MSTTAQLPSVLLQTPHPVLPEIPLVLLRSMPAERAHALWQSREEAIDREARDPLRYGHEPAVWAMADRVMGGLRAGDAEKAIEILALGGNRGTKTEWAAKRIVQKLINSPGSRAWCLHSKEASSRDIQQSRIFKYLPAEWRVAKLKKSLTTKLNYSEAGGFTENMFILPNGSRCWFKFYSENVKTVEGTELDIAWSDELVPLDWVEAVERRLASRSGSHLITFTPIEGYTATVARFLDGAVTTEEVDATLLPIKSPSGTITGCKKVPRIQRCREPSRGIVYFHTADNPYGNALPTIIASARGSEERIKKLIYGVPTKSLRAQFPLFNPALGVHLFKWADLPKKGTWFHVADPCSGRNFFMIWALAATDGRLYIAREWPQPDDYIEGVGFPGVWAERAEDGRKLDGQRGEAQEPWGFGHQRVIDEIARVEKELGEACGLDGPIRVEERFMDSRFGASPTQTHGGFTTLIEEFEDLEVFFEPASGEHQKEGITLIENALFYRVGEPITTLNRPRMVVCERCENTIFALQTWTGADGQHGACKDPIDCLRYLHEANPDDLTSEVASVKAGRKSPKNQKPGPAGGRGY